MSTDTVADMLTRIRNGYMASSKSVKIPYSKLKENIAKLLVKENYLESFEIKKDESGFSYLLTTLKYVGSKPSINKIRRVSKPGLRIYKKGSDLHPVLSGMGIKVVSTSKGLMTNKEAKKQNIGGEVLFELW